MDRATSGLLTFCLIVAAASVCFLCVRSRY